MDYNGIELAVRDVLASIYRDPASATLVPMQMLEPEVMSRFLRYTKAQLKFVQNANNLELSVIGQTDKLVIGNWYASAANQVEEFRLDDGSKVLASEVQGLLSAMAVFNAPATLTTTGQMTAQPVWRHQDLVAAAV